MRDGLPQGTVTFLFTDIEGSTRLLLDLGESAYGEALAEHRRMIRDAATGRGGVEVDNQGDALFLAFPTADGAARAAVAARDALANGPIRVRMGLHTGQPQVTTEGYVGMDVHLAARIAAVAHGGQIVLSQQALAALDPNVERDLAIRSLGEHRLKDIGPSVRIHQVGDGQFPLLRSTANTNLPTPVGSFLGRAEELATVHTKLEAGARLVTLTGPGGTGKTRMAIAAAAGVRERFPDGVIWIGLATIREPSLVIPTISSVLGVEGDLATWIGGRRLLLVLDNVEQVVQVAPGLADLLAACPALVMLVTSRITLRISGETQIAIGSLPLAEAVALFTERSGLAPSAESEELCERLDALPLAIELAAARARVLGTRAVLDRLAGRLDLLKGGRDLDPRQQTLRATIAWSDELLDAGARTLFRGLSIFAGGCTLEAAETVVGADVDQLQTLVEHSLVRMTDGRFWMLETIRSYAGQGLADESDLAEIEEAFCAWALEFLERENGLVRGPAQVGALGRLDAEIDNIRAAFALIVRRSDGDPDVVRRFAIAAQWWLARRGFIREATAWIAAALDRPGGDPRLLGWTLFKSVYGEFDLALSENGRANLARALRLGQQSADEVLVATVLETMGYLEPGESGWTKMEAAGKIFADLGRPDDQGRVAINLAARALNEGEDERALEMARDGRRWASELGNRHGSGIATASEAAALALLGRDAESAAAVISATRALDEIGERVAFVFLLETVALLTARRGMHRSAASMLGSIEAGYARFGIGREAIDERLVADIRAAIGNLDDDLLAAAAAGRNAEPRELIDRWLLEAPAGDRAGGSESSATRP